MLDFFVVVVLEAQPRRSPGELPSFLDVLVLGKKKDHPMGGLVCLCACDGLDQHQTDHADYAKQNGNDRL